MTRPGIPVKAVAVWDTVGCLGVPDIEVFGFKLHTEVHRQFSFINTEVPGNVEYAYHALALDEERKPYSPTLWEYPKSGADARLKLLKQCWFPGCHSSVGGGYADTSIADVGLAWLVTQLSRHLTFKPEYMRDQQKQNEQFYIDNKAPVASWAMGMIQRSDTGMLNTILGRQTRAPGQYYVIDPTTGKPTTQRLANTCEFIHPSVRYRTQQKGPGLVDSAKSSPKGTYEPKAMAGWSFYGPNQSWRDDKSLGISKEAEQWDAHGKWMVKGKDGTATFIVEEDIEPDTAEMELLRAWPGIEQKVLDE
jgi:hypothetical protein